MCLVTEDPERGMIILQSHVSTNCWILPDYSLISSPILTGVPSFILESYNTCCPRGMRRYRSSRRHSERDDNFSKPYKHTFSKVSRTLFDFRPNFDRCALFYSRILHYLLSKGYVSSNRRHSERNYNFAKPRKHKLLNSAINFCLNILWFQAQFWQVCCLLF